MIQSTTDLSSYLLVVTHEQGTSEHPLVPGRSVVLGSSPHCGIQLVGDDVASMHCVIDFNDGVLGIQDWASSTGTIVNGTAIAAKVSISENDQVKIGSAAIEIRRSAAQGTLAAQNESPEDQDDNVLTVEDNGPSSVCPEPPTGESRETHAAIAATTEDFDEELIADQSGPADSVCDAELPADDYDWNADFDEADDHQSAAANWDDQADTFDQYDAETVQLLKAEIDDLRSMLADRDLHLEELSHANEFETCEVSSENSDHEPQTLQWRVDELLAEAAENDERYQILQDLLETTELKNQAERDERQELEAWVGEIEHRIGQRESEWKAEIESVRQQLSVTEQERNQLQHKLREVASRFGAQDVYRETLDKLQSQNAALQEQLSKTRKQAATCKQQLENLQNRESEAIQEERAVVAKERASVSRLRFELSRKLSEFEQTTEPKHPADKEVALRLQTLRSHLREIHEQEQEEREQKGESLFTRISGIWKKMDEY